MKKLSPPTDQRPTVSPNPLVSEKANEPNPLTSEKANEPVRQRPTKLKAVKMKSLKNINQSYKVNNQAKLFIEKITSDLEQYNHEDIELNYNVLADVYNKAVRTIVYGSKEEREEAITYAVKTLMSKYFRDDDNLDMVLECIKHVPTLVKSTILKRAFKRLMNWLLLKKNQESK